MLLCGSCATKQYQLHAQNETAVTMRLPLQGQAGSAILWSATGETSSRLCVIFRLDRNRWVGACEPADDAGVGAHAKSYVSCNRGSNENYAALV